MRAGRVATLALLGGTAAWAARDTVVMRRLRAAATHAAHEARERASRAMAEVADEPEPAPDEPAPEQAVVELAPATAAPSDADWPPVDVDDPADLVEAERDLLTVPGEPGEDHRRRDQTAGPAAQEVAAAQVRLRRNAYDDL